MHPAARLRPGGNRLDGSELAAPWYQPATKLSRVSAHGLVVEGSVVCRGGAVDHAAVSDPVHQLLATDVALDKLGGRGISAAEAEQLLGNRHTKVRNPGRGNEPAKRALLIGSTDGGRILTW